MVTQNSLIAGQNGGKRVNTVPATDQAYRLLKEKAKTNYWAQMAVACIHGLTSGRLGKKNIFVRPTAAIVTGEFEQFYMVLPGCMATMERRANDQYYLVNLTWDASYAAVDSELQRTGLYKASKNSDRWRVSPYPKGKTDAQGKELRIVAISDAKYENAQHAVRTIAGSISKVPDAPSGAHFTDMDLHYTHDKGRLGGLLNYDKARKPLKNHDVYGSAILLARSMVSCKENKMTWVSEAGGSAVLTQALRIVSDNNVKLSKHSVYFFEPTTSSNEAIKAAQQAGINIDRDAIKTGFANYMGNRDHLAMIYNRYRGERGYNEGHAIADVAGLATKGQGAAAVVTTSLGLVGLSAALPALPAFTAIAGALGFVGAAIAGLKVGESLVANAAPHFYNRNIGKIK